MPELPPRRGKKAPQLKDSTADMTYLGQGQSYLPKKPDSPSPSSPPPEPVVPQRGTFGRIKGAIASAFGFAKDRKETAPPPEQQSRVRLTTFANQSTILQTTDLGSSAMELEGLDLDAPSRVARTISPAFPQSFMKPAPRAPTRPQNDGRGGLGTGTDLGIVRARQEAAQRAEHGTGAGLGFVQARQEAARRTGNAPSAPWNPLGGGKGLDFPQDMLPGGSGGDGSGSFQEGEDSEDPSTPGDPSDPGDEPLPVFELDDRHASDESIKEPGIGEHCGDTELDKLYNGLVAAGYYLPLRASHAITLAALNRLSSRVFIFLREEEVYDLDRPIYLRFSRVKSWLMVQQVCANRKDQVFPFENAPNSEFIKKALLWADPRNEFRLFWGHGEPRTIPARVQELRDTLAVEHLHALEVKEDLHNALRYFRTQKSVLMTLEPEQSAMIEASEFARLLEVATKTDRPKIDELVCERYGISLPEYLEYKRRRPKKNRLLRNEPALYLQDNTDSRFGHVDFKVLADRIGYDGVQKFLNVNRGVMLTVAQRAQLRELVAQETKFNEEKRKSVQELIATVQNQAKAQKFMEHLRKCQGLPELIDLESEVRKELRSKKRTVQSDPVAIDFANQYEALHRNTERFQVIDEAASGGTARTNATNLMANFNRAGAQIRPLTLTDTTGQGQPGWIWRARPAQDQVAQAPQAPQEPKRVAPVAQPDRPVPAPLAPAPAFSLPPNFAPPPIQSPHAAYDINSQHSGNQPGKQAINPLTSTAKALGHTPGISSKKPHTDLKSEQAVGRFESDAAGYGNQPAPNNKSFEKKNVTDKPPKERK
jgi:hypothetical protein